MDIERPPQEKLRLRVIPVLAVEHPEFRKTLGRLGMPGPEYSLGKFSRLSERFQGLCVAIAFETRRAQLPIASCYARAIRASLDMFSPQNIDDPLLRLRVSSLLELYIHQRILRACS